MRVLAAICGPYACIYGLKQLKTVQLHNIVMFIVIHVSGNCFVSLKQC